MSQLLGLPFGNGSDGVRTVPIDMGELPTDSSCSGTSGSTSLSATNTSFASGDLVLIHQSRGTSAGAWELNRISSYSAGTITTLLPLANTYTDSGASQAQVSVVPEYTGFTINSGVTLSAKSWGGDTGGIMAYACSGTISIVGTISVDGAGFRGRNGGNSPNTPGSKGEGDTADAGGTGISPQGSGGGGGNSGATGGGGGGNGDVGSDGSSGGAPGLGGLATGNSSLTIATFGGGGGGGGSGNSQPGGNGNNGGGLIFIFGKTITITGSITATGANGTNGTGDSAGSGGGGGGAGGSIFLRGQTVDFGASLVTATGGAGGAGGAGVHNGGRGAVGRIRVEACKISGEGTPTSSKSEGGFSYCSSLVSIL